MRFSPHICTHIIHHCPSLSFSFSTWAELWRTMCHMISSLHCCCIMCRLDRPAFVGMNHIVVCNVSWCLSYLCAPSSSTTSIEECELSTQKVNWTDCIIDRIWMINAVPHWNNTFFIPQFPMTHVSGSCCYCRHSEESHKLTKRTKIWLSLIYN